MINDIFINVIAGLIATCIISIFTFIIFNRTRFKKLKIMIFQIFSKDKIFFYINGKQQTKALGSVGEYIKTTQKELIYIGYWLTSASNGSSDFINSLEEVIDKNIIFKAYLINPHELELVRFYASYFDISEEDLIKNIQKSVENFKKIKEIVKYKNNIEIYFHSSLIQASCYIFDKSTKDSKVLIDHKFHSFSRSYSYGFEFSNNDSETQKIIIKSYEKIIVTSLKIV